MTLITMRCSCLKIKNSLLMLMYPTCHVELTVLFTSLKCQRTVVNLHPQLIRLVLNMVPDTAMPNAHKISNSSMEKPMSMDGTHHQVIQMLVKVNGDHAAPKWIFGKPTLSQVLSLPIHVPMMDSGDAK